LLVEEETLNIVALLASRHMLAHPTLLSAAQAMKESGQRAPHAQRDIICGLTLGAVKGQSYGR